ncbi:MAG: cation:proton antiporter [Candidatus Micrarchaeota archaeon]
MFTSTVFILIGAIIFIGFLGTKFFERTKVSELLILMLLGFLIGPVFNIVDQSTLIQFVPLFAGLALIILLFDGGLNLNFHKVFYELAPASAFTLLVFTLSVLGIGTIVHFLVGWDWLIAFMFAAVVGGTSSPIVFSLVASVKAREEVKTMLQLESALTDALTIVAAIAFAQIIISNSFDAGTAIGAVAGGFSIAFVIGLIIGAIWVNFLKGFTGKFDYMLTLAAALVLYGAVEFVKGNGGIAVLTFGIVLGNAKQLTQMITQKVDEKVELPAEFKSFQNEISFFVRTFFFVYIGVLISLQALTVQTIAIGIATTIVALIARFIVVKILGYSKKPEATIITTMMPRGLAAAVMSSLPAAYGINAPGFTEMVMLVIIGSNIISSFGVFKASGENNIGKPTVVKVATKQTSKS